MYKLLTIIFSKVRVLVVFYSSLNEIDSCSALLELEIKVET